MPVHKYVQCTCSCIYSFLVFSRFAYFYFIFKMAKEIKHTKIKSRRNFVSFCLSFDEKSDSNVHFFFFCSLFIHICWEIFAHSLTQQAEQFQHSKEQQTRLFIHFFSSRISFIVFKMFINIDSTIDKMLDNLQSKKLSICSLFYVNFFFSLLGLSKWKSFSCANFRENHDFYKVLNAFVHRHCFRK